VIERNDPPAPRSPHTVHLTGTVLVEKRRGIVFVTINRPQKRDAMDPATMEALADAADAVDADPEARVMVLTGAGNAFSSGMDLQAFSQGNRSWAAGRSRFPVVPTTKPAIAAVNGPAIAGGFELCGMRPGRCRRQRLQPALPLQPKCW